MGPSRPRADTAGAAGPPRGDQAGPLPTRASRKRMAPPETSPEARACLPAAAGLSSHAYAFSRPANSPGPRGTHPPALSVKQGGRGEPPGRDGGAVRPPPSACSGPGPVAPRATVRSSSRADGRAGAGACLPARPLLSSLLPPPSSLAERQQADSNLSSDRRRRHSRRGGWAAARARERSLGGGADLRETRGCARALGIDPPRSAPDAKGAERAAEAPEGSAVPGARLPGGRARRRQGGAGRLLRGFLLRSVPPAPPHQEVPLPPSWGG